MCDDLASWSTNSAWRLECYCELETELGEQKFMNFLTQVLKAEVRETDALIELLAQVATREVAARFLLNLKQ